MQNYSYTALNQHGRKVTGTLNAANETDLYQRLQSMQMELVKATEGSGGSKQGGRSMFGAKVESRDLIQLCLHLQQLLAAGVGLMECLADIRGSTTNKRMRDIIAEVYEDVTHGMSLSQAFGRHPKVFGTVFQSLITVGEESGNLPETFAQLVRHLKWSAAIAAKIKKATRYPMIMMFMMFGLFLFMMTQVVPQVSDFLTSNGAELPFATTSLISTSAFVSEYWEVVVGVPAGIWFFIWAGSRLSEDFSYYLSYLMLRLPAVGPLTRKIALSRFSHFFATMFHSGIPILRCLETSQRVVGNPVLARSLAAVQLYVQEGNSLSGSMDQTGEFPSLVTRMVKIGEDSGKLDDTLKNVTEFYDVEVDDGIDGLVAMISPLMTVFAAGLMLWIIVAVFGSLYDSFAKMGG